VSDYKTTDKTDWFIYKMRSTWFSRQEIVDLAATEFPDISRKTLNGTIGQYWSDSVNPKWSTWKAIRARGLKVVTANGRRRFVREPGHPSSPSSGGEPKDSTAAVSQPRARTAAFVSRKEDAITHHDKLVGALRRLAPSSPPALNIPFPTSEH
jgi:hypothetical protein